MIKDHRPILSAIVAMAENRVIGKNNQLPWHLPADLRHFKQITTGNAIIMGRKTYESIGKPLPNRTNIVISRNLSYRVPGCQVVGSIEEAVEIAEAEKRAEIFIIGGSEVYEQLMPYVEKIYMTIVHQNFEGDAYFPELNSSEWTETEREDHAADAENKVGYSFVTLKRHYS